MSISGPMLGALNALAGGLFLLTAFAMVATRQTRGCLLLFIYQSLLLAASAFLLAGEYGSSHLVGVGVVNLISKPIVVPLILRRTLSSEIYTRREIDQALNIPTSLTIALALAVFAYFLAIPLVALKILILILVLVIIESSLAKLRLFRISEFLGAAFITCVAAMITRAFAS